MATVYILWSESLSKFYIGHTSLEVEERVASHNLGHVKWTSRGVPWILVYTEQYSTKGEAMKRENQIKRWKSSSAIRKLIEASK